MAYYSDTVTLQHDTGDDIEALKTTTLPTPTLPTPMVRKCPLCKGTGLIKAEGNPVGYVDG